MRRSQKLSSRVVGPAVQRADDALARRSLPCGLAVAVGGIGLRGLGLQQDGLAMTADVRYELDAALGIDQSAPAIFLGERIKIAYLGYRQAVPDIARILRKQNRLLLRVECGIKVSGNGQLAGGSGI